MILVCDDCLKTPDKNLCKLYNQLYDLHGFNIKNQPILFKSRPVLYKVLLKIQEVFRNVYLLSVLFNLLDSVF